MNEGFPNEKNIKKIDDLIESRQKLSMELEGLKKETNTEKEIFRINELETNIKGIENQLKEIVNN
ncbi:MAG: hypothetical protein UR25_C0004G0024 [Candidatus Nomurabacteria bacterium GW2011_GWE1_32_28]|uniref:Uncharacterized protein n=1 Tax=Candidatus Nomurabacteria bacterium GW2011_GWF1_31_48 TaxID=1618767 RepID=A0A0G0AU49_9BACT|nr:MAG: hypothetical protein UR10_C0004G0023 [Candidatus Nomurabacteria bacterium GW2011_GWF2_30_133]KKP28520.1 MAG: hypothetical protein UR18_C0003G0023 [Candidatus Nomurabacteria bacterium GW2011_GWE2_31_40]KKP30115.1 MAG: hypothetical protein UR19_C0004G0023 [Candidatus Nomurabacteria bacterium GW2011_GWF1_31_48]KKP34660.1 MAG: hypothetical protein UR25_C0004G0024 [Candidatus Nomurabacteria bacterium GW2011_GWE1_32_28]HAS80879.1 hypothetical protein [Candidatus Nomurabacteria bacterium]